MKRDNRNRELVIQRRTETQEAVYGTATVTWTDLATVWAEVQDILPSRAERVAEGIDIARRPCRVRMLYRDDVTTDMRFKLPGRGGNEADRILQIIAGPAELGFRERVEFVAEELSTGGQEP